MKFEPGKLYRVKQDVIMYLERDENIDYAVEAGELLTYLWTDHVETHEYMMEFYLNKPILEIKRFLFRGEILFDNQLSIRSPEEYFEEVDSNDEV
jgi:hypothetical protein